MKINGDVKTYLENEVNNINQSYNTDLKIESIEKSTMSGSVQKMHSVDPEVAKEFQDICDARRKISEKNTSNYNAKSLSRRSSSHSMQSYRLVAPDGNQLQIDINESSLGCNLRTWVNFFFTFRNNMIHHLKNLIKKLPLLSDPCTNKTNSSINFSKENCTTTATGPIRIAEHKAKNNGSNPTTEKLQKDIKDILSFF